VHPYRIAILVFAIGASAVNLSALKGRYDALTPVAKPKPALSATPSRSPLPAGLTPFVDPFALAPGTGTADDPVAVANYDAYEKKRATDFDGAAERELAILTVAGVAWFLVRTTGPINQKVWGIGSQKESTSFRV
jgi:hypothetical protein